MEKVQRIEYEKRNENSFKNIRKLKLRKLNR